MCTIVIIFSSFFCFLFSLLYQILFEIQAVTFERHNKDQGCAAGSFDFIRKVDNGFALALLHGELAAAGQLTALAHDFTIICHFQFIEDQLMFATTQILDLHSLIRLDFLAVKVEYSRRSLILKFNVQHQFLSFYRDGVFQLFIKSIGIYNSHKKHVNVFP